MKPWAQEARIDRSELPRSKLHPATHRKRHLCHLHSKQWGILEFTHKAGNGCGNGE